MSQEEEDSAGGISYRTMKGIDTHPLRKYLEGRDEQASQEILEKNKEYYIASAHKIITRLELAQIRVKNADLDEKEEQMLDERLSHGLEWLKILEKNIKLAKDRAEFLQAVPYKKWHAVKLMPSAAEGYAINASIIRDIEQAGIKSSNIKFSKSSNIKSSDIKKLKEAEIHSKKAGKIFLNLLNLKESSDFKAAEKARIEAYNETNTAVKMSKNALNPSS